MANHGKRLIEVGFPSLEIAAHVGREKTRGRQGVAGMHLWWGRRPLALSRAALFTALAAAPDEHGLQAELLSLAASIADPEVASRGDSDVMQKARQIVADSVSNHVRVLDPFAGSGSFGLEALRLGVGSHSLELNPVAHLIELCTLVYPQHYQNPEGQLQADIRLWAREVYQRALEQLRPLYLDPVNGQAVVAYLWSRTVFCPRCGTQTPLTRQWQLAATRKRSVTLVPVADESARTVQFTILEDAQSREAPGHGVYRRRAVSSCLVCGEHISTTYVAAEAQQGRLSARPLVVVTKAEKPGLAYRLFSQQDQAQLDVVQQKTSLIDAAMSGSIPGGLRHLHRYGFTTWTSLLNVRQAGALSVFAQAIRSVSPEMLEKGSEHYYARAVATYLALALDKLMAQNTMLGTWNSRRETVTGLFARPGLSMAWDYVEINPVRPNGPWQTSVEAILAAIRAAAHSSSQPGVVQTGTATELPYPTAHFDLVVVDPPYYDAIQSADLSEIFYLWLREAVGELYPELFGPDRVVRSEDLAAKLASNQDRATGQAAFEQSIEQALAEASRVLRPGGVVLLLTHYRESQIAVTNLLEGLLKKDLIPTASWLVADEAPALLAFGKKLRFTGMLLVCRKRTPTAEEGDYLHVRARIRAAVREALRRFERHHIPPETFAFCAIGPALAEFMPYAQVVRVGGEPVTVAEVFGLVQDELVDYAIVRSEREGKAPDNG
jgi:putative DNA methylase